MLFCDNRGMKKQEKASRAEHLEKFHADRDDILRRLHNGELQKDLAEEYGVAKSTISRLLHKDKRQKAREKERAERLRDPHPTLADEHVQARFWQKYQRFREVLSNRHNMQQRDRTGIKSDITENEKRMSSAPTAKLRKNYKMQADILRQELIALEDVEELDEELTELLSELSTLSYALCKVRKCGLGKTKRDSYGHIVYPQVPRAS